jgi:Gluconate 2-dehydrogenase subunit 3
LRPGQLLHADSSTLGHLEFAALYCDANATEKEIAMSDVSDSGGPLRHFRVGRRAVLQSLAAGAGAAVFAARASAEHVHQAAAVAADAVTATDTGLQFLDQHAFDTLATLSEQIVPGSRAAKVPEFLDQLLAVESTDTQKTFMQALGAFEQEARAANGLPWKALTESQAAALLTKISAQPASEVSRHAFDRIKGAVAETYFQSEVGMKELGWDGSRTFAPPSVCG